MERRVADRSKRAPIAGASRVNGSASSSGERDTTAQIELVALDTAYRFYLIWRDRAPLLVSRDYANPDRALADIERLRQTSTRMQPCMTTSGRFYFGAVTEEGDRLAQSPHYERPSVRDEAMEIVAGLLRAELEVARFA